MKFEKIFKWLLPLILIALSETASAQRSWEDIESEGIVTRDTVSKNGFTLIFINKDPQFSLKTKERMIDVFFTVYPKEAKTYNPSTSKKVICLIDPKYMGVAAAGGGLIRVNPEWMRKNPEDLDVLTHEAMHIIQSYPNGAGPGWITEGIADYVRFKLGVNNKAANWTLPEYKSTQRYTDAYRVTARFFLWIEKNYNDKIIKKLDHAMRTKTYTESFWVKETGKSVDTLWVDYSKSPSL